MGVPGFGEPSAGIGTTHRETCSRIRSSEAFQLRSA